MDRPSDASHSRRATSRKPGARGGRLVKASALGALSCAVASAGLMGPADALVRPGHTVFVLKDDSIVEAEGYRPNESVLIQVKRNGVVVGSARASSPDGVLAVNHDSCWDRYTPRILGGDVVEVTSSTGKETLRVADIDFVDGPTRDPVNPNRWTIRGTVNSGNIPASELVAFARTEDPVRYRPTTPDDGSIAYDAGGTGAFTATFTMSDAQAEAFPNLAEPSVAHAPTVREQTIATGAAAAPGPGCAGAAPMVDSAVSAVSPALIGRRNAEATIRVQGFSQGAENVTVRLRGSTAGAVSKAASVTGTAGQTWRASFTAAQTRRLNGRIRATAVVDGVTAPVRQSLLKDLVAPKSPSASIGAGTYRRTQFVSLNTAPRTRIRYTVGTGKQARPNANRGRLYRGGQLRIARTTVLKMVAVDAARNVSPLRRIRYVIR